MRLKTSPRVRLAVAGAILALALGTSSCGLAPTAVQAIAEAAGGGGGGGSFGGGGGGGAGGGGAQNATLVLFAEDQAADNVHSFEMTLTGITLTSTTGTPVSLLPSSVELEWVSRSLAPTLLSTTQVPAGTYNQLEVLVASPQMVVYNPSTGLFDSHSPALTVSSVTLSVNISLNAGDIVGFRLDFDLLASVISTTQVTPQFALISTSFLVGELPGDIDDALGTIDTVDPSNNRFTMTLMATRQQITIEVDANTIFDGVVTSLAGLATGQRVEVDARLQSSGNYRGLVVEVDSTSSANFVRGLVLARSPATGDATSVTLLVREENPDQVILDAGDQLTFSIDASTAFRLNIEDLSVTGLTFDRQELRPGQSVLLEADSTTPTRAAQIVLKQGTIPGQVATVGITTFNYTPLSNFFPDVGFATLVSATAAETEFEDLPAGLGSMVPGQTVGVRGLFVEQVGQGRIITKRVRLLAP